MKFDALVGEIILIQTLRIHPTKITKVKLVGTEPGGIWIESQELTNVFLQAVGAAGGEKTPAFFLPYHQISFAIATIPGLSLDEKAFGL